MIVGLVSIGLALWLIHVNSERLSTDGEVHGDAREILGNLYAPSNPGNIDQRDGRLPSLSFRHGYVAGKQSYNNPIPYRSVNPDRHKLNESEFGSTMNPNAVNPENQQNLIDQVFYYSEYPLLDATRLDLGRGKGARAQPSFYYSE